MISRSLKTLYYRLMTGPMWVNGWCHRRLWPTRRSPLKVQLGPGQKNYLPGWCNVDANFMTGKVDIWADIRHRLPFADGTVDVFYSHHVIEHLPDDLLPYHFGEMFRCLKPGGCIRVGGPDAENAARQFIAGNGDWFSDFPDKRSSVGGRYANFILCRGEHFTLLTESYLREIATGAGFIGIARCRPKEETYHPTWIDGSVFEKEYESAHDSPHTLLIEAEKPI